MLFDVCLGSLSCWQTCSLWLRHSFLTLGCMLHYETPWQFWYCVLDRFRAANDWGSKATPKTILGLRMFHSRHGVLYIEDFFFFFCKYRVDVIYHKALIVSSVQSTFSQRNCSLSTCIWAHVLSDSDGWWNLKLLYLELEDQLGSILNFSLVLSQPFEQFSFHDHDQRCWLHFNGPWIS